MAITFDAVSSTTDDGSSSYSVSHTVSSGSDRLLIVASAEETSGSTRTVTGITFNSVALTKINHQAMTGSNTGRTELWYLLNPDVGTYNVTVTFDSAPGVGSSLIAASYFGVKQQAYEASGTDSDNTATTHNIPITTITNNALVVATVMGTSSGVALTSDGGQNNRAAVTNTGSHRQSLDDKIVASAGSASMQWTCTANDLCSVIAAFEEASAAAGGNKNLTLLGVGV